MASLDTKAAVEKIKRSIKKQQKPALLALSAWIWENLNPIDLETWEDLRDEICKQYSIDKEELAERFRTPTITHASCFEDDFLPLIRHLGFEGTWLGRYVEHTLNMEAPTPYHFFSALAVLGAALKRQTWVDQGYYKVWPAVQTIIVGPSQKVKKSTSGAYAVGIGESSGRINRLMDEGTQEALKSELADLYESEGEACGLIFSSELATMLGEKDYNRDMVQTLTDIFDSRSAMRRRTRGQGDILIRDIAVSFIGCSNETWLRRAIPPSAFEGGFMARVLLIWQGGTDRVFPRPVLASRDEEEFLKNWLAQVQLVRGEAVLTSAAETYYEEHYRYMKENWPEDERLNPFWERFPDHMLRLAMLFSVSADNTQRGTIHVDRNHVHQAKEILDWVLRQLPKLYSILGMTQFGDEAMDIIQFIYRNKGVVTEGALRRKMLRRMSDSRLNDHLNMLKKSRMILWKPSKQMDGEWEYILLRSPEEL
jgi:hypothetical protein